MSKYAIALGVALLLNASANLFIKFGVRSLHLDLAGASALDAGWWGLVRLFGKHWILLVGLACFAANVVFYAYALQRLPISVAYPVMVTTGFAIIVVVAGMLLGERLSPLQWIGVTLILVGVVLVARDAGRQVGASPSVPSQHSLGG